MTYLRAFREGNLVLPSALFFHFHEIFDSSDDFLVWQFFYLQNTSAVEDISPSKIAESLGKTVAEVNRSMSSLTEKGLLQYKTIELNGEIEAIFDALPALERLDEIEQRKQGTSKKEAAPNDLKNVVTAFEQELGRLLTPFELEDLGKTLEEGTKPELVKAALREAVFNGKPVWSYIQAILRNWRREGITSVQQVEAKRREREQFDQKQVLVSDEFVKAMDLWKED
ncbi:DnaD domain-containing protein [Streptococcus himalayensis]|uniref:DNA replication protein DnaD n=1 Tax=Streptococcus himalayensis TaxID=1888195 RepID=A0A917A7F0_9STRE|nr:DnaD domain-containing protein [Streptococcus himalayensis]GGE32319.1 DNA replication protein DnaD [Streptococcus himalayensis]